MLNSTIKYNNPITGEQEAWRPSYICTALDPWTALRYVLPLFDESDTLSLDLYCFDIIETDDITLRNDRTWEIIEVRVANTVCASRVRYLATRRE